MFKFKQLKQRNHTYICWGLTVFLTVLALFVVFDLLLGSHRTAGYFKVLATISTPVVYGCVIAYLLYPIVDFFERTILHRWATHGIVTRKPRGWVRIVSILLTFTLVWGFVVVLLRFLIPDVWASILKLAENIPMYVGIVQNLIRDLGGSISLTPEMAARAEALYAQAMDFLTNIPTHGFSDFLSTVSGGVVGVIVFFTNLIVGFVVAAYMLGMKERLTAQCKKIICAVFEDRYVGKIMEAGQYTDAVFGGFIRGNILDAFIVGIICFIAFQILGFPYAPLLSVLIGVTNLIPFFGPFLGAIPSCILIFLDSPLKCLEFIIFILIFQQIDGNIIVPRILGRSTGLSSLWVIISVLIGGGLFGPIGMLLGCPVFALIYALVRLFIDRQLEKKSYPVETDQYRPKGIPERTAPPQDTE